MSHIRAAGLKCNIVTGMNKKSAYEIGSQLQKPSLMAQWNVVFVTDQWRLCDVFWALSFVKGRKSREWALLAADGMVKEEAGEEKKPISSIEENEEENIHTFNEFYFLTDPDKLICMHIPKDSQWQLLPHPFTEEKFEKYAYLRERFFELEMTLIEESKEECLVKTDMGEVRLVFGLKESTAQLIDFKFHLYKAKNESAEEPTPYVPLHKYVTDERLDTRVTYSMKLPVTGRFRMDLFGKNLLEHDSYELVCAYIIDCPVAAVVEELPSDVSYDPRLEIRFRYATDSFTVLQNLRHNAINEILQTKNAITRNDGPDIVVNMKLPPRSMDAFKMFADDPTPHGEETNEVHKYLMKVIRPGVYKHPYPELHGGILGKTYLTQPLTVKCKGEKKDENKLVAIHDGRMELEFEVNEDVQLLCDMTHRSMKTENLKGSVQELVSGKQHSYVIDLPEKGEYGINIYARYRDDTDRIYHVYTCMADYDAAIDESAETINYPPIIDMETMKEETNIKYES